MEKTMMFILLQRIKRLIFYVLALVMARFVTLIKGTRYFFGSENIKCIDLMEVTDVITLNISVKFDISYRYILIFMKTNRWTCKSSVTRLY